MVESTMVSSQTIISTKRLILRPLGPIFAEPTLDYLIRNRAFFEEWNPSLEDAYYTLDFQRQRLRREWQQMLHRRLVRLYIFKRQDQHFEHVIGDLAFSHFNDYRSCFLGYKLDKNETNQGYMTEALDYALRFGFGQLRLHRIEANIMPRNLCSRRVVEKLGFVKDSLIQGYLQINGVWEDHIRYVKQKPC